MDYKYIESLVKKSKDGDKKSKEKLVEEFKSFILNLSKMTFIDGYDLHDIHNECYKNLFKCLSLYRLEALLKEMILFVFVMIFEEAL